MKKLFALLFLFCCYSEARAACSISSTSLAEQECVYSLAWQWQQGEGPLATGFIMQQMVDENGNWYDIHKPIPVATKTLLDTIKADAGGRRISYRVVSYLDTTEDGKPVRLRSGPSNVASVVTSEITIDGVRVISGPGMVGSVSRRATDTTSVISILINKDEVLGPDGLEIVYPADKQLSVSRRPDNNLSVISILVNKSEAVVFNGQVK